MLIICISSFSQKNTLTPSPLLHQVACLVKKPSLAVLLAIYPTSLIYFSRWISESAMAVFFSLVIIANILWAVWPSELPLAVELPIQPISFIHGVVRVCGSALSFRRERFQIEISFILSAILVLYSCLHGRIVVEMHSERLIWVFLIIDSELASCWARIIADGSFVNEVVAIMLENTLPLDLAMHKLSVVDHLVFKILEYPVSVGKHIEVTLVENLSRPVEDSLAFRRSILVPLSQIVLIMIFVLFESLWGDELLISWMMLFLPYFFLSWSIRSRKYASSGHSQGT